MSDYDLDARKLLCPLPVIKTQDQIGDLNNGDILTVTCTDPGTLQDIPAWCRIHGHTVIETRTEGHEQIFAIKVHKSTKIVR